MGYGHTIDGLLRKRAEMAGEVEALQAKLGALISDMTHIDATIRVFRPDIDLADLPEKLAPAPFTGFRGEIQRFLIDTLRTSERPMNTHELAAATMRKRGLDPSDRVMFNLIAKRTGYALAKLRKAGKATSKRAHRSAPLEWELTRG
jgi:hypothetical protein